MKKTVFTLAILMLLAPFAGAQGDKRSITSDRGPESFGAGRAFFFAEKLDLNDEQKDKIKVIRDSSRDDIVKIREEIRTLMKEVKEEMSKKDSDKKKIYASIDKVADKQKKLSRIRTDQILEIKSVLNDEQFKKLTEMMEKKRKSHSKKFFDKDKYKDKKKDRR
ncbi:MAG TPA: periplasmic heavy metal sensor [bacterium]|nr:periplasmic heavy metal sensor [bacterium]